MSSHEFFSILFLILLLIISAGCISPKTEVKTVYITVTPTEVITPKQIPHASSAPVSRIHVTLSPTQTQINTRYQPKFEWGDIIEDPYYNKYIILEGHPDISGVYTTYKIIWCPCVRKAFLDVQDTDKKFRKVGTQNPNTICGGAQLTILTDTQDSCYYPNSGVVL